MIGSTAATMLENRAVRNYYAYQPSQAAAGVFCALYGIGLIVSIWQTIRYRAWIWFVMILAIAMETVGYAARVVSAGDTSARTVYIIQFCLVILAPVFMAGIIYVVFGRIVFHVVPPASRTIGLVWLPARWITPIFVGFDIFALFLQLIGAVLVAGTQVTDKDAVSKLQKGKDIALAGVTIQIAAFGLFTIAAIRFHFTSRRFIDSFRSRFHAAPGDKFITMEGNQRKFKPGWRGMLYAVNATCALILIRSVYREIEFAGGKEGYTQKYEYFFYILDAAPMFLVVAIYNLFPPGAYVSMGLRQPKEPSTSSQATAHDEIESATYAMAPYPAQR